MMDKKKHSKCKGVPKQNGEKFQRFRSKVKKTFSKTMNRSYSIPRSSGSKILKNTEDNSNNNRSKIKSNDSSRSSTPDIFWFSKMSRSTISNDNHERIELNDLNFNKNNHCFINQISKDKFTFCDICNKELFPIGSVLSCKYCQVVVHDKCRYNSDVKCQNNRLSVINNFLDLDRISINEVKTKIATKTSTGSEVKLRKKPASADTSPAESEYHTCKTDLTDYQDDRGVSSCFNFYHGGVETMQCRDSLVNVTSIASTSSLISQISYEFTTLDSDSIKAYGIEVNPINQRGIASLDDSLTDVSSIDSAVGFCSIPYKHSDDSCCRASFIYHEPTHDMLKIDWTNEELNNKMELFNQNNFGLSTEIKSKNGENFLLGTVRVYINLLRPIKMEFAPRPSSIFDVISSKDKEELFNADAKIETLWLPRGTSKRLYVNQSTTTSEVINGILNKFHIKANPKKFGLYEHTIEGERRISVRKLADAECPLTMLLMWTDEGVEKFNEIMAIKRLVLQENETGDIEWTVFSQPELRNFLLILEREEQENRSRIKLKYSILKDEIMRLRSICQKMDNVRSAF